MSHVDGKFCDEGFRCKKCKAAWMKQTEIESLRAKVKELEEKHDVACQTINQLQRHRDTLQGSLARQMQAFLDEQSKVKVLTGALEPFSRLLQEHHDRLPDSQPVYGIGDALITIGDLRKALATVKGE